MLTDNIKKHIKNHALTDSSKEQCGVILKTKSGLEVIRCQNIAVDSDVHFIISRTEIDKIIKKGWIVAVYHTHCKNKDNEVADNLSEEDLLVAEYFNVTYIMYSLMTDEFYTYKPTGAEIPYVGRPFISRLLDDIQLISDYYKRELNINLNTIKHRNNFELWLQENAFAPASSLQINNIIVINWEGNKLHKKLAIYQKNHHILIHPDFNKSKLTLYNYGMQKWTDKIMRHSKS